jgi:hypothetical protein
MQIVEQMMTRLSWYALLHIKINKYIKINILKEKNYIKNFFFKTYYI